MYWPYVAVTRMDFSKIYKRYGENISVLHVTPNTFSLLFLISFAFNRNKTETEENSTVVCIDKFI